MTKLAVLGSYYKSEDYLKTYLKSARKQAFKDFEIFLEVIDPKSKKEEIYIEKITSKNSKLNINKKIYYEHYLLPTTWNISIDRSESELICLWNLDDLRTPDSLSDMVKIFDTKPEIDFVYGNYKIVDKYKSKKGNYINEINREGELTYSMILGPFFMFRRNVLDVIGKFDEQFISGADFDFAMRLGRHCKGYHLNSNLGYFLNLGKGLSTKRNSLQEIERTAIEIRYGLNVINQQLIEKAQNKYDVNYLYFDGKKHNIKNFLKLDKNK